MHEFSIAVNIVDIAIEHAEKANARRVNEVELEIGMVVEGIRATEAAIALAEQYNISVPIAKQLHQVITESKSPMSALEELMSRNMNHAMRISSLLFL